MPGPSDKNKVLFSSAKIRSPRNKTMALNESEIDKLAARLLSLSDAKKMDLPTGTYNGDYRELLKVMPSGSVSLLVLDPPYNMSKDFNGRKFARRSVDEYMYWLDELFTELKPVLKDNASIYICGDWFSSVSIYAAAAKHFIVRSRICWEREKGRGARANWKNSSEDIWFCTVSDSYFSNIDAVKLRRKVIAPYRDKNGILKIGLILKVVLIVIPILPIFGQTSVCLFGQWLKIQIIQPRRAKSS